MSLLEDDSVKPGETVRIVVAPTQPAGVAKVRNESTSGSSPEALVGGGAGAVAGGLWGLACGPLAGLCVPLGIALGGDLGIVAGWAVGTTAAIPADKAELLRERVTQAWRSHDVPAAIETELLARARGRFDLTDDRPSKDVFVEATELMLSTARGERVRCILTVTMTVRWMGADRKPKVQQRVFTYTGQYAPLGDWLDDADGRVGADLAGAAVYIAAQVTTALQPTPGGD